MSDGSWLLWVKVLGLVLAGAVFGWWQLKDVSKPPFKAHPVESDRLARDADCDNPAPRP